MRILTLDEIKALVSEQAAIDAVRDAFIAYANGDISQPEPIQILFQEDDGSFFGDCHVKAAQRKAYPYFVIKVAAGFYKNKDLGLPVNNGLVLVMSAETGQPMAALYDEGWLTQMRTAAAGAISAALVPHNADTKLGIIGTGMQGYLQAQLISRHLGLKIVNVLGRDVHQTGAFADRLHADVGLDARAASDAHELCHKSDIVITATPSTEPVIKASDLPERLHIVAVGADSRGKCEIDPSVLAKANAIATDNHAQCMHHGDFGNAFTADAVSENEAIPLCDLLAGKAKADFTDAKISVVDLTGIGAQDLAVANLVVSAIGVVEKKETFSPLF